jgi:hypothetical protein
MDSPYEILFCSLMEALIKAGSLALEEFAHDYRDNDKSCNRLT